MKGFVERGDCYRVVPDGEWFVVIHYRNRDTREECCHKRVRITDADRAQAIPDADPHGACACLHRAYVDIEAQHAKEAG